MAFSFLQAFIAFLVGPELLAFLAGILKNSARKPVKDSKKLLTS